MTELGPLRYWTILMTVLIFAVFCISYQQASKGQFGGVAQNSENDIEGRYFSITEGINLSKTPGNDLINQPSTHPDIAVSHNNIYVVWLEYDRSNNVDKKELYFTRSTDGGATFGDIINLSGDTGVFDSRESHKVVESENNVYVLWRDDTEGRNVFLRSSIDGGDSFGNIINITGEASEEDMSISNGNLYVAWGGNKSYINNDFGKIYFTRSTDHGATFENATIIKSNTTSDNLGVASWGSNVYIIWKASAFGDIYFTRSTDRWYHL